jgi:hypothetical protein
MILIPVFVENIFARLLVLIGANVTPQFYLFPLNGTIVVM